MTSWLSEAVAAPAPRTRTTPPRPGRADAPEAASPEAAAGGEAPRARRGAIAWIAVSAALLAGRRLRERRVLRLNLAARRARTTERRSSAPRTPRSQSQLSSALASPQLQSLARSQDGLVDADPATSSYIDLEPLT